jgi:hypothetical protein
LQQMDSVNASYAVQSNIFYIECEITLLMAERILSVDVDRVE